MILNTNIIWVSLQLKNLCGLEKKISVITSILGLCFRKILFLPCFSAPSATNISPLASKSLIYFGFTSYRWRCLSKIFCFLYKHSVIEFFLVICESLSPKRMVPPKCVVECSGMLMITYIPVLSISSLVASLFPRTFLWNSTTASYIP